MRKYTSEDDKYLRELNAEPWMVELLKLNPAYPHWGPHEDYMWVEGEGWNSRVIKSTWTDFGPWELDDYNECVHFYFELVRDSIKCSLCGGCGLHPDAQWISESFYEAGSPFTEQTAQELQSRRILERFGSDFDTNVMQRKTYPSQDILDKYGAKFQQFCEQMRDGDGYWRDKITEDEVAALIEGGRLHDLTSEFISGTGWKKKTPAPVVTAEMVNAIQKKAGLEQHDAINQHILVEQRCKRLGVPHLCPDCNGNGHQYTAPGAHVSLVLWMLHPRKGASRGVEVKHIEQGELEAVFTFLQQAAQRNAARFEKIIARGTCTG